MKENKSRERENKTDFRQAKQGIVSGMVILGALVFIHWLIVSWLGLNVPFWLIGVLYAFTTLSLVMDFAVMMRTKHKLKQ